MGLNTSTLIFSVMDAIRDWKAKRQAHAQVGEAKRAGDAVDTVDTVDAGVEGHGASQSHNDDKTRRSALAEERLQRRLAVIRKAKEAVAAQLRDNALPTVVEGARENVGSSGSDTDESDDDMSGCGEDQPLLRRSRHIGKPPLHPNGKHQRAHSGGCCGKDKTSSRGCGCRRRKGQHTASTTTAIVAPVPVVGMTSVCL